MKEPYLTSLAVDNAVIEKAGMPDDWKPYCYQSVAGGTLITGCKTRPKKSGKNKGEPLFLTKEDSRDVVVTSDDVERHKQLLTSK